MADHADLAILTERIGRLRLRDDPALVTTEAAGLRQSLVDLLIASEARTNELLAEGRAAELADTVQLTVAANGALADLATVLERRAGEWDGDRRIDALTEAVAARRALVERAPDTSVAGLAASLDDLAVALGAAGRDDESLAAAGEAVTRHRRLAEADPDHRPVLARALRALSLRLRAAGHLDDALDEITEAVELFRGLTPADPGLLGRLAASVGNRSATLRDLGRLDEAVTDGRTAVELYRGLADGDPTLRPHLADALHNLALACTDAGLAEAALAAVDESVAVRRTLAADASATVHDELARSLRLLAARHHDLGHTDDALAAVSEAADEYEWLGAAGEDDVSGAAAERAYCLMTAAMLAAEAGRDEQAVASFAGAIDAFRDLARDQIDPYLRDAVTALFGLSRHHLGAGRDEAAFETIADAVNLVADNPEAAARVLSDTMAAAILAAHDEIAAATGRPTRPG
ncbi:MAG: tetratricopeptide repeat protein [Actinomycetota bacterium]|nr:tetratricopeptide repeat protein [Actinomycetota bacterium]